VIAGCAKVLARDAGESEKNRAGAHRSRGVAYHYKPEYDRAIKDLDEAKGDPRLASSFYLRGVSKLTRGDGTADNSAASAIQGDIAERMEKHGVK
jgi:hypothetical protein